MTKIVAGLVWALIFWCNVAPAQITTLNHIAAVTGFVVGLALAAAHRPGEVCLAGCGVVLALIATTILTIGVPLELRVPIGWGVLFLSTALTIFLIIREMRQHVRAVGVTHTTVIFHG